ncbi:MAG: hypothetical protein ABSA04_13715 [Desulfobaccales bacterium]|jgi:hypothetical protein
MDHIDQGGRSPRLGVLVPEPEILQAVGGGVGGGAAASGWRMVDAGGSGPGMATAGQGNEPITQGR